MTLLLMVVIAYLIGSLPVHAISGRKQLRPGMLPIGIHPVRNLREGLVLAGLQVGKGALATLVGLMFHGWTGAAFAAAAVVLGDLFSVFQRFQGGRGIAVAGGTLLILSPLLIVVGASIYLITLWVTRYLSVSAVFAALGVMLLTLVLFPELYVMGVVLFAGSLIMFRHRDLFKGRYRGAEPPIRWRGFRRWR